MAGGTEVAKCPGLPGAVADFGKPGQCLLVVVEGLLVAALPEGDVAKVVELFGFADSVTDLLE